MALKDYYAFRATTIVDQKFFTYGYFYNQLQTNVKIQYMFKWHMF